MKALVRRTSKERDMILKDMPEPIVSDNTVKIKIKYSSICASDIKYYNQVMGPGAKIIPPVIIGHEGSGIIVETGSKIKDYKVGDEVCFETTFEKCGKCMFCKSKEYNICDNRKGLGSKVNGTFAEYVIVPEESLHKLPDGVNLKTATLMEPLACAVHLIEEQIKVKKGDNVLIIGPGAIGFFSSLVAKSLGGKVILSGTNHSAHRLKLASELGIETISGGEGEVKKRVFEMTNNIGADVTVDCVGSEHTLKMAVNLARKNGIIGLGSFPKGEIPFNFEIVFRRQLTLIGSQSSKPSSWIRALELMKENHHIIERMITDSFTLDDWEEAFKLVENKSGFKVVFKMN
ncbi:MULTISPECIES: zinc-dependent alcohol dehydrogenase [Tissierellales]|jgi:2-desacetyl-2-hydroxyethyl bacteriochlorophyllide A dehydrogenase|uniref:Sorbitol dehydrogenase n=1 Tax=Acidilutibacter cellobiosedens TaxID=2507161 RepID=A0A410QGU3_9FIRM|nr:MULTISPECIES: zinc-binding dehydrogenase [Tissierellales]MBE6081123.1 sorbitol dehydrogenase [Tissierellaceae bacterium]QAT63149.1 sorbitol dehydrogenase [Acidilutibacter cellobiosedens]SCL86209.1 D-arabitol-phosphate dehydrogenase [Sporanaerobacter sp. PP17-6a]